MVGLLMAAGTLIGLLLDPYVSLTSQAMVYVLMVVVAAYKLDWVASVVCAVFSVTALNFFFVPPRLTFDVASREHLIALAVMLVVALVISHLATSLRRESRHAALGEQRARQSQMLSGELANTPAPEAVLRLGLAALDEAFGGPNTVVLSPDVALLNSPTPVPDPVRDGLRCCMKEQAVLGPGTGRWPGLDAWYFPLKAQGQVVGAARVSPALAGDTEGREHAQALCALLAQTLLRIRLASLAQAAQNEAQREQLKNTFLAAVSHDLRTPLAAIVGAASSLQTQRDKLTIAEQDRLLGSIAREAAYLSTLTENTLQLVQLTSAQQLLRRDWESLEEIVGTVLARVRQRDLHRRITAHVPAGLPLIKADPVLLAQLITNLLDNALKYSDGEVELGVSLSAQTMLISVKDRGPGIEDKEVDLIFEPYRRGDQSGSRGAGLGLALCRAIALAHDGRLTVHRRRGGGSCFQASLPLNDLPSGEVVT
jgi:two-component system sensor histidine kinase KdpD